MGSLFLTPHFAKGGFVTRYKILIYLTLDSFFKGVFVTWYSRGRGIVEDIQETSRA